METTFSTTTEVANNPVVKPKGKAAPRKAPAKKGKAAVLDDDDDEILELKDRLAAYKIESSPEPSEVSAMETEVVPQVQAAKKKEPNKRAAAAKKKTTAKSVQISDDDDGNDDFEVKEVARPAAKKGGGRGGGRKAAATTNTKTTKPPAAAAKLGQKLITQMLEPAAENSGISPEKKVRKIRASPFNKKSGSILGRTIGEEEEEEEEEEEGGSEEKVMGGSASSETTSVDVPPARGGGRIQRANRTQVRYVISGDSDSEAVSEDSDFDEEASIDED